MPQLDGLRALAVFGVLVEHYLPKGHFIRAIASWGEIGVQLFFTLSGFLITAILLRCRDHIDQDNQGLGFTLKRFYIRRTLRIFPLFYVAIAVLAVLNIGEVRETIFWHVTYLSNVGMSLEGRGFGHSTHFWSLAVEEQFYLFWPLMVLAIPERWLVKTIFVLIIIGPLSRLGISLTDLPWVARSWLPMTCFDSLLFGALLAVYQTDDTKAKQLRQLTRLGLFVGIPLSLATIALRHWEPLGSAAHLLVGRTVQGLAAVWLIHRTSQGFSGAAGKLLSHRVPIYLGSISYGIYVIHHFTPDFTAAVGLDDSAPLAVRFVIWTLVTIALASLSWHFFEKPINQLKARYPYKREASNPIETPINQVANNASE